MPGWKNQPGMESEKWLHLADVGSLAVQQFLGQNPDRNILAGVLMDVFQSFDDASGIALNHHAGDFAVGIFSCESGTRHHV